jgi:FeS assembly SUF system protein
MMRWPWSKEERKSEDTGEEQRVSESAHASETIESEATPGEPTPDSAAVEVSPTMSEATPPMESPDLEAASAEPDLAQRIVETIKTVYDPEIPVDIYELGLIYEVDVRAENAVYVKMTLTSPMCPVAETLPPEVEQKVRMVEGVKDVELELVWDPPWNPDMMSEAAKLELNM